MAKNDPTNAGYDQPPQSYDQTNAGYNQPGQNQPPQPGYYQPQPATSGQPQPVGSHGQPPTVIYGQPQPGSSNIVPVTSGTNTVIVQDTVPVPPHYMALACVTTWCCCPLFVGIAALMSLMSINAADRGDMKEAQRKGKASMVTSIAGFIMGITVAIVFYTILH